MEVLKGLWDFFQNQVLGMKWLNELIGKVLTLFGLDVNGKTGASWNRKQEQQMRFLEHLILISLNCSIVLRLLVQENISRNIMILLRLESSLREGNLFHADLS